MTLGEGILLPVALGLVYILLSARLIMIYTITSLILRCLHRLAAVPSRRRQD